MSYEKSTIKSCLWCGKEFKAWASKVKKGHDRFCSIDCGTKARTLPPRERFLKFLNKTGTCWLWTGRIAKNGYGRFDQGTAHRASWVIHFGPIPRGLFVLHRCDIPACCNPQHLFLGTARDNAADCIAKGRNTYGERVAISKLTDSIVMEMRALASRGVSSVKLGQMYSVSQTAAWAAVHGKTRKHIPIAVL